MKIKGSPHCDSFTSIDLYQGWAVHHFCALKQPVSHGG